ncbi:MAG: iron-containing alcohol dehydrogenase [Deltaproteobacteria bacterium]|nr:iron-containing alcohol dehydrogenase [Deltaproteobacteria bacterium]
MNKIFSFMGARKILFGRGSFERLGECLKELKGARPFVVVDPGLESAGIAKDIERVLSAVGLHAVLFSDFRPEPFLESVDGGARRARKEKCDIVVGIGGGSAMDMAKAIAVVATNGGKSVEYLGLNQIPAPGLPKIMVPTTAGTGSEVTFTSVFVRKDLKKKQGMNSPFLYPEIALLDPCLTLTAPPDVTAATGLDALCHAIESFTSINSNPMSELLSLEAIGLIAENLRTCVHEGKNLDAREAQLLGSLYAGLGLANAGVTAVHSLSYPLGGKYGVPHGLANTILLPAVMRYNLPGAVDKFAIVADAMGEVGDGLSLREQAEMAVEAVGILIEDCGILSTLADVGVLEEDFEELAGIAMTVARPLENNPRKITPKEAVEIYRDAF